jgi:asparagine synthase (glutamine-hydrolysing)
MCGIVGYSKGNSFVNEDCLLIQKMGMLQYHRGPDAWGEYSDNLISFGHNRLSIIDIKGGHQPMWSFDEKYMIIFNGEIYNYIELKKHLQIRGVIFKTNSDTEVIVNGFAVEGVDFFSRLSGMYSFAIYDKVNSRIVLCRDHVGIKPLYFSVIESSIFFSSELKPIIKVMNVLGKSLQINSNSLLKYFHFRSGTDDSTLVENIFSLKPSHYLVFDLIENRISETKRYSVSSNKVETEVNLELLDSLLLKHTKSHLISDVPVGVFLSGGVDSSLLTQYASTFGIVPTFTVRTNSKLDESKYARMISEKCGTSYHEINVSGSDFLSSLPYWNFVNDDPVSDPSSISLMLLSKHVKESGIKVMLAGEGADELFAGYNAYLKYILYEKINDIPIIGSYFNSLIFRKFKKQHDYLYGKGYLGSAHISSFKEKSKLFNDHFNSNYHNLFYKDHLDEGRLRNALSADLNYRLPNDLLTRTDRATMAYSIEARVPFLAPEIIEFSMNLSQSDLVDLKRLKGKKILKMIAENYFPKAFVYRKKQGFDLPIQDWLEIDLKELIYSYLYERKIDSLNYGWIRQVYEGRMNVALIWAWFQLESWFRMIHDVGNLEDHPLVKRSQLSDYFTSKN